MSRRISREHAMKLLYQFQIRSDDIQEQIECFLSESEENTTDIDKDYFLDVVYGVMNNLSDIDSLIKKHAKGWSVERMPKVILYQGLPKSDKMDWIIQKTVELGIYKIVPVITQFSIPKVQAKDTGRKVERWNRISFEAAKQCGRVFVPRVSEPVGYETALNHWSDMAKSHPAGSSMAVFCYEGESKKCLKDLFKCYNIECVSLIGVFIGPEGGFSHNELHLAGTHGISPVSLGRRTLRTETAPIVVLSVIMHEMSEMLI